MPVLYVLSIGPVGAVWTSAETRVRVATAGFVNSFYEPVWWLIRRSEFRQAACHSYLRLWGCEHFAIGFMPDDPVLFR